MYGRRHVEGTLGGVKVNAPAQERGKASKGLQAGEGAHRPLTSGLGNHHLMPRPSEAPTLITTS